MTSIYNRYLILLERMKVHETPAVPVLVERKLKPRREWIDYARGIAIILVVFKHVTDGFVTDHMNINMVPYNICRLVYYARMPLFFVVSGIYIRKSYEKRGFASFMNYKFATIFYPYLVWATIQLTMQLISYDHHLSNTPRYFSDYLNLIYKPHDLDQFWFLYVLFFEALVFAVLQYFFKLNKWYLLILGALTYIIFYYLPPAFFVFGLKTTCKFLFYIALGDVLSKYILKDTNFLKFASLKLTALLLVIFAGIRYLIKSQGIEEAENDFFSWSNGLLLLSIFSGLALIMNIAFVLERFHLLAFIKRIGRYSLYIYTMHIIVNGVIRAILMKTPLSHYHNLDLYIVTLSAVLLPIIIYKGLNHMGMWFLYSPKPLPKGEPAAA